MGEHVLGVDGVGGSSPPASTKFVASCSSLVSRKGKTKTYKHKTGSEAELSIRYILQCCDLRGTTV